MLIGAFAQYFFGITIFIASIFLVLLVLVQRGRGGGLTGALGGPGGQSAFGTKAGDLFTRITIVVASVWIFLCAASVFFLKDREFTTSANAADVNTSISSGMGSDETESAENTEASTDGAAATTPAADAPGTAEATEIEPPVAPEGDASSAEESGAETPETPVVEESTDPAGAGSEESENTAPGAGGN